MDENNQSNEGLNTEKLKKEAANTASQVKETFKNADFKKDANETKGFLSSFIKNPIDEIEVVANSSKNNFLKITIIILAIWLVAIFIGECIDIARFHPSTMQLSLGEFLRDSAYSFWSIIKALIAPILSIAILSSIIYFTLKENKKPFTTIASSIVVAKIPVVLASVVSILEVCGNQVYKLTNPFSGFCSIISTILLYFTLKALFGKNNDSLFIKKFAIIIGIYYIAKFIISFFGISI